MIKLQSEIYDVGLYCRLSRDDHNSNQVSMSIENQQQLLTEYAKEKDWRIYDVYIEMKILKVIQFDSMNPPQKPRNKGIEAE